MFSSGLFNLNTIIGFNVFRYNVKYIDRYYNNLEVSQTLSNIGHAVYISGLSICYLRGWISEQTWYSCSGFSCGYALYDLYLTFKINRYKDMLFHHSLMVIAYWYPIMCNFNILAPIDYFPRFLSQVYLCEISTIPLSISFSLYKLNKTHTNLFKISSVVTLLTYFPLRVCNFTYLVYYLYKKENWLLLKFLIPFTGLNYYWFYKLCDKAMKTIKNKND